MAKINGATALFTHGGATVDVTSFTINYTAEVQNTTDSSSAAVNEYIANGYTGWDLAVEGFVQTGDAGGLTLGGAAEESILTAAAGVTYTGDSIVTSKSTAVAVNGTDAVKISYTLQGTGVLTEVNA